MEKEPTLPLSEIDRRVCCKRNGPLSFTKGKLTRHDPDGYMVELCNCENIPILPLSSCSFKPRLSSFNRAAPAKCGFVENAMMESLSMEMLNISF
ncbi:hypothetical protein HRI_000054600 [Hibiscus trionum]|uniref:Uncharacterized protein n=1 Tax=Hibiscus trionum TaxID=183268 RepID=A0A9W7GR68_HIBTR|nr:hypothetical protein HRI_000054600 [Hibiscus trionum]